ESKRSHRCHGGSEETHQGETRRQPRTPGEERDGAEVLAGERDRSSPPCKCRGRGRPGAHRGRGERRDQAPRHRHGETPATEGGRTAAGAPVPRRPTPA